MTRRQAERAADVLDNLAVAMALGAGGDLVVLGVRSGLDSIGLVLALAAMAFSQYLTGRMGGPKL